ncbi:MAG TPA: zinc-dependent metalloprotease [Candidatus Eisenbacteria bacterium]|nr:zinc-dependent metalloprotease [Candidatus Eisenbacteria bacterium]
MLAITCAALWSHAALAAGSPPGGGHGAQAAGAAPAMAAPDKPYGDWKKLTTGADAQHGFFNVYKKRESLYLELTPEQMKQPVLCIVSYAHGIGSNFLLGGLPLGDHLLEFQRAGDHVLVIEKNTRFVASNNDPMAKAVDLSTGSSVLASLKVESEDDGKVLVDLAPFVVSDLPDLAEQMRFALAGPLGPRSMRFDKDRSALGKIKVFPENAEVEALLTYSPNDRTGLDVSAVSDERFIPITVHYSFSKLPEHPMQPRIADDRVGYFLTAVKDFSKDDNESFWVRYVNRWRLEKKDPTAAVSEPVKPIVYYIDRTVPVQYRPYVKKGIENWQKAFEAAGFKNAIIAKDAPDDPDWDPEDVRYSTIRWITSSEPAFGAIGPSRVDPRTGEILDADILVEASIVQGYRNIYRRYAGPDAIAENAVPWMQAQHWPSFLPLDLRCDMQQGIADGGALMNIGMLADGSLPPGSPVPEEYIGQAITEVTMHEVGHTLGLRHNFRSSTSTPLDKLSDVAWTSQHGLTSSVMDYPTPNISADRSKQGQYFTSTVGDCDDWVIRYGYTPTGESDPQKDRAAIEKIADESTNNGHEYSTDEDTYPADALDPRSNIFDLGNDPLGFAKDRTAYIQSLWRNGKLPERILGKEGDYPTLRRAMDTLLAQYATALGMAVKYVGGQYNNRLHHNQDGAPLVPVPAARQRDAIDFLARRAFAADAFSASPQLLNELAPDRWSHWGMPSAFGSGPASRLDYNYNDRVLAIQSALLGALTAPNLMARVREAESHVSNPFRLSDEFELLTHAVWGEVGAPGLAMKALEGPSTRRELQRAYVDRLSAMVTSPAPGTPDDARALARLQLTKIDQRITRAMAAGATLGDYARAHLLETRARIRRTLDARRLADVPGPAGPGRFASPVSQP